MNMQVWWPVLFSSSRNYDVIWTTPRPVVDFSETKTSTKTWLFWWSGNNCIFIQNEINKQKANKHQEKLICGVTFLELTYPLPSRRFCQWFSKTQWLPILLAPPEVRSLTEKVERIPTETTLGCGKNGSSCCCTEFWCRLVPKFMEWKSWWKWLGWQSCSSLKDVRIGHNFHGGR